MKSYCAVELFQIKSALITAPTSKNIFTYDIITEFDKEVAWQRLFDALKSHSIT